MLCIVLLKGGGFGQNTNYGERHDDSAEPVIAGACFPSWHINYFKGSEDFLHLLQEVRPPAAEHVTFKK